MFTVGQDLYVPTARDLSTLQVAPFFQQLTATIAAASTNGAINIPIPLDRALWIHSVQVGCLGAALSTWTAVQINSEVSPGVFVPLWQAFADVVAGGLAGEGQAVGTVAQVTTFNVPIGLVLPPGTRNLNIVCTRSGTTNAVNFNAAVIAYQLPPGGIGRA